MPGFNKTGPWGLGSMTGKGLGPCSREMKQGWSRLGRGMKQGWSRISHPWTKEEKEAFKDQK